MLSDAATESLSGLLAARLKTSAVLAVSARIKNFIKSLISPSFGFGFFSGLFRVYI